jgi:hypothetical protein
MPESLSKTIYPNPIITGLKYGIELEIEAPGLYEAREIWDEAGEEIIEMEEPTIPLSWELREEHSIEGPEVVSMPLTYDEAYEAIGRLFIDVNSKGYHPTRTPRGSTHIHVNCQDLTWDQLESTVFACAWAEPFLIELAGRGRIGNLFAVSYKSAPLAWENIVNSLVVRELRSSIDTHYSAVNFNSLLTMGTIEFRMGPSSRTAEEALYWLGLIRTVAEAGRTLSIEDKEPAFLDKLTEELSQRVPPYNFDRIYRQAIRQVQELAFRIEQRKKRIQVQPSQFHMPTTLTPTHQEQIPSAEELDLLFHQLSLPSANEPFQF